MVNPGKYSVSEEQAGNLRSQYWKELYTEEVSSPSGTRDYLKKNPDYKNLYPFIGHSEISPTSL